MAIEPRPLEWPTDVVIFWITESNQFSTGYHRMQHLVPSEITNYSVEVASALDLAKKYHGSWPRASDTAAVTYTRIFSIYEPLDSVKSLHGGNKLDGVYATDLNGNQLSSTISKIASRRGKKPLLVLNIGNSIPHVCWTELSVLLSEFSHLLMIHSLRTITGSDYVGTKYDTAFSVKRYINGWSGIHKQHTEVPNPLPISSRTQGLIVCSQFMVQQLEQNLDSVVGSEATEIPPVYLWRPKIQSYVPSRMTTRPRYPYIVVTSLYKACKIKLLALLEICYRSQLRVIIPHPTYNNDLDHWASIQRKYRCILFWNPSYESLRIILAYAMAYVDISQIPDSFGLLAAEALAERTPVFADKEGAIPEFKDEYPQVSLYNEITESNILPNLMWYLRARDYSNSTLGIGVDTGNEPIKHLALHWISENQNYEQVFSRYSGPLLPITQILPRSSLTEQVNLITQLSSQFECSEIINAITQVECLSADPWDEILALYVAHNLGVRLVIGGQPFEEANGKVSPVLEVAALVWCRLRNDQTAARYLEAVYGGSYGHKLYQILYQSEQGIRLYSAYKSGTTVPTIVKHLYDFETANIRKVVPATPFLPTDDQKTI